MFNRKVQKMTNNPNVSISHDNSHDINTHSTILTAVPEEGGTKGCPYSSTAHATLVFISPVVIKVIISPALVKVKGKPEIKVTRYQI